MLKKIRDLMVKYWDVLSYLFFGVLTTAVNYVVYFPCYHLAGLPGSVSNVIAWIISSVFAFLTNKAYVFKSRDWSSKILVAEGAKFFGCRVGSGALESGIILLFVDIMGMDGTVWKIITSILVIILNYVGSKLLVFKNK